MFTFLHDIEVPTHKGNTLLYNKVAKIQAKLSTLLKSFGQYLLADTISKRECVNAYCCVLFILTIHYS